MKNIMINLNTPVTIEDIRTFIAESPVLSVLKFGYNQHRFTIEHHEIGEWTIVIETITTHHQAIAYLERVSTFMLGDVLNKYLV